MNKELWDNALQNLEKEIICAFPEQPSPSIAEIVDLPYPYDSSMETRYYDNEIEAVRQFFGRKIWRDLVGHLPNCAEVEQGLSYMYMVDSARRYYLPAYILTFAAGWKTRKMELGSVTAALFNTLTNPKTMSLFDPLQRDELVKSSNYKKLLENVSQKLTGDALQRFEALDYPLLPPGHVIEGIQRGWEDFMAGFTEQQNQAIKHFLKFLLDYYDDSFETDVCQIVLGNPRFQ